jgi:hypothetical protein
MDEKDYQIDLANLLASRLERLSVDSLWAHRASGMRGSLLRCLEQIELAKGGEGGGEFSSDKDIEHLNVLITQGFEILKQGAMQIEVPDMYK